MNLTPELAGKSILTSLVFLFIGFIIQLYVIWLNWKQSKVKDLQEVQLEVLKEIRELLKKND